MRCLATLALLGVATGCQLVLGYDEFEPGGAGSGGSGAIGSGPCSSSSSPADAVGVRIGSGECVWMDTKEVSRADYELFLADIDNVEPYRQPPCAWKTEKTDFQATCGSDAGTSNGDRPVTCVDWCDANAYCISKGKTLCADPTASEDDWWLDVCSSNDAQGYAYPYGEPHDPEKCAGSDNPTFGCAAAACELAPVGSLSGCVTPSGVFDLAGNAAEWVGWCASHAGENDQCRVRGGGPGSSSSDLMCDSAKSVSRSSKDAFRGFRCCWRP